MPPRSSRKTYERRLNQLIKAVSNHTHRDELLNIMNEQINEQIADQGEVLTLMDTIH